MLDVRLALFLDSVVRILLLLGPYSASKRC